MRGISSSYSVNDPHHLGGGLLAFLFSKSSVIRSGLFILAIRKSDRLDFVACFALSDCLGQLSFFVMSILYSFSAMSIMMSRLSFHLSSSAPSQTVLLLQQQQFSGEALHYFLLFSFFGISFPLCFPSQMYHIFQQRFTVVSLLYPLFSCYHRPMLVVSFPAPLTVWTACCNLSASVSHCSRFGLLLFVTLFRDRTQIK